MRLEGEIHEIELIPQLVELGRDGFTGALRFERDSIIKIVYFKAGDILSASTNDRGDSLDEILLKAGKVNREHIKQALEKRKDSETLGDALYSLGFISRKELSWARRVQLVGILRSITSWPDGSFQIVPDYLPKREEGTLFQIPQIVIELIVTETDREQIERALPSDTMIEKLDDFPSRYAALNLNEEADEIVSNLGSARSVSEVASDSKSDPFSVFKLIHALITLGLIRKKVEVTGELSAETLAEAEFAIGLDSSIRSSDFEPADPYFFDGPIADDAGLSSEAVKSDLHPVEALSAPGRDFDFDSALLHDDAAYPTKGSSSGHVPLSIPSASTTSSYRSSPVQRESARRNRKPILLVIGFALLMAVGLGSWYWLQSQNRSDAPIIDPPTAAASRRIPAPANPAPVATGTSTAAQGAADSNESQPETSPMNVVATAPSTTATSQTTTPPPTNAPVPAAARAQVTSSAAPPIAASSGFSARAAEHARNADRTKFALQIEVVCQDASIRRAESEGGPKIWYIPTRVGDRACYRVLFGSYATREEAARGAGEVPRSLKDGVPAAVAISKVVR